MGDDGVVLTDGERQALAGLAESIGDPWLARQLAGEHLAPPPKKRPRPFAGFPAALRRATAGWIGVLLLVGGAVLAVVTFTASTAVAALALGLMGVGAWRLVVDHADDVILRWTARQSRTAAAPPPPRTPPGAV